MPNSPPEPHKEKKERNKRIKHVLGTIGLTGGIVLLMISDFVNVNDGIFYLLASAILVIPSAFLLEKFERPSRRYFWWTLILGIVFVVQTIIAAFVTDYVSIWIVIGVSAFWAVMILDAKYQFLFKHFVPDSPVSGNALLQSIGIGLGKDAMKGIGRIYREEEARYRNPGIEPGDTHT